MTAPTISISPSTFEVALKEFSRDRKRVSDGMYTFLRCLVVLMTSCAVTMAAFYGAQLGESWLFKLVIIATAIGIECAVVFFSAVIYPPAVLKSANVLAGVLLPALSLFTVMSFMVSQQFASDNSAVESLKREVARLETSLERLDIGNAKDRGTIKITNDRLAAARSQLLREEAEGRGSKATAIYHYLAHTFGVSVETIILAIRFLWGICFVSLTIALDAYVDTRLYSASALDKWVGEWRKEQALLKKYSHGTFSEARNEEQESDENDRHRRAERGGEEIPEDLYREVREKVMKKEIPVTVRAIKTVARGSDNAYQAIDRLLKEQVIYQKDNGRYDLASSAVMN